MKYKEDDIIKFISGFCHAFDSATLNFPDALDVRAKWKNTHCSLSGSWKFKVEIWFEYTFYPGRTVRKNFFVREAPSIDPHLQRYNWGDDKDKWKIDYRKLKVICYKSARST